MFGLLRLIRGIAGLVFALQVVGLFPVFSWLGNLEGVTPGMLAMLFIKLVVLVVSGGLFFWLRQVINRLHQKRHGAPHPSLATRKLAL